MRYRKLKRGGGVEIYDRSCRGLVGLCLAPLLLAPLLIVVFNAGANVMQVTESYGDILSEGFTWHGSGWDLTQGDIVLSYTVDNSEYYPAAGCTAWSSIGLGEGAWGWMASGAPEAYKTNPELLDMDDKLNLGAPDRYCELTYDAIGPETLVTPPIGATGLNYGVWFDRDGVDDCQDDYWGMDDGVTYNTGGVYDVVVTFHSIDATIGTMFATVNGVQTGFYDTVWKNAEPEHYPVGKSISGDLTNLQVFASIWGAEVKVYDLTVSGYKPVAMDVKPGSAVDQIYLGANGNLPIAVMGSEWLDVNDIDPDTVMLGGTFPDGLAPMSSAFCDVNRDGYLDVVYLFEMVEAAAYIDSEYETVSLSFSIDGQVVVIENSVDLVGETA